MTNYNYIRVGDISKLLFPQQQNELAVELLSMLQNSTIDLMFVLGTNRNQLICKMTARLRVEATLNPSLGNQRKAKRKSDTATSTHTTNCSWHLITWNDELSFCVIALISYMLYGVHTPYYNVGQWPYVIME